MFSKLGTRRNHQREAKSLRNLKAELVPADNQEPDVIRIIETFGRTDGIDKSVEKDVFTAALKAIESTGLSKRSIALMTCGGFLRRTWSEKLTVQCVHHPSATELTALRNYAVTECEGFLAPYLSRLKRIRKRRTGRSADKKHREGGL